MDPCDRRNDEPFAGAARLNDASGATRSAGVDGARFLALGKIVGGVVEMVLPHVGEHQLRAVGDEHPGDAEADAARSAGDEGDLAVPRPCPSSLRRPPPIAGVTRPGMLHRRGSGFRTGHDRRHAISASAWSSVSLKVAMIAWYGAGVAISSPARFSISVG